MKAFLLRYLLRDLARGGLQLDRIGADYELRCRARGELIGLIPTGDYGPWDD